MDHFEYNDELFYDFRDPNDSDGECDIDEADLDALDTDLVIKDEYDDNYLPGLSSEPIAKDPDPYPYVKAVKLQESLKMGMSLLEKEQEGGGTSFKLEGTSSVPGSISKIGDLEKLKSDLRDVLLYLIRQKEALNACTQAEVFRGGAAAYLGLPSDTCKVSYQADLEEEKEEVQKGTKDKAHKGEDLETSETLTRYAVTGVLHEKEKEYILDPAVGTEDQGMKDSEHREEITTETHVNTVTVTELLDDTDEAFGNYKMSMLDLLGSENVQEPQGMVERDPEIQYKEDEEEINYSHKQAVTGPMDKTQRICQEETAALIMSTHTEDPAARLDLEISVKEMTGSEHLEESTAESHRQAISGSPEKTPEIGAVSTQQESMANAEHEEEKSTVTHPYTISTGPSEGSSLIEVTTLSLARLHRMRARLDQTWLSTDELENMNLKNSFQTLEPGLSVQICTLPTEFKSSRAIFLRLPHGNILWDCISYVDEETVVQIAKVGGIQAIIISSPDKMGACVRLSYIFNRDKAFYPQPVLDAANFWDGPTTRMWDGVTIIRLGGHFEGSSILHLDHRGGIVFSSNTLKVKTGWDRQSVSVMKSYNNYIPVHPKDVRRILGIVEEWDFDEVWGDQPQEQILERAKSTVISSLKRYIRWSQHDEDALEFETRPLSRREMIARGKRKVDEV